MYQDLRLAFRLLWRDKAFTLTAATTLAVCIGANIALYTVVDNVLLRPLHVPRSDQILLIYNSYPKAGVDHAGATVPDYYDRLRDMSVFDEQTMFQTRDPSLDLNGAPERIHTMHVTPSFFRLVQTLPAAGRRFTDEEGELGKNRSVILSEGLRRRLFAGQEAVGQNVRIDGDTYAVVGVMPADFTFVDPRVQAWIPLAFTDEQKKARYSNNHAYIGRLKPGATLVQAQAQVDGITTANFERFPESRQVLGTTGFHVVVSKLQDDLVREVRSTLYLLSGGALFVLLIGCVNVASLVLVRSRARFKEIATRVALGAGRLRIMRQLVTEHMLLTVSSAIGGLGIGYASLRLFGSLNLEQLPRGTEIQMDAAIVLDALVCAAVIGFVLGAIPAFVGLPANLSVALREEGRGGTSGRGARTLRRVLVVTQVAVAFVLLIGAGLLFASFRQVLAVDPGFKAEGVLTASINMPLAQSRYSDAAVGRFAEAAVRAIRSMPGVMAAGATSTIPFGDNYSEDVLLPEGYTLGPGGSLIAPYVSRITPGYFETMNVRLVSGRFFEERDGADAPKAVIVDERLARRFWPNTDPIGRRMYEPSDDKDITAINDKTVWYRVVGVVGEVKLRGLVEGVGDTGAYYLPEAQSPARRFTFAIRTSGEPTSVAGAIRTEISRLDREIPVYDVRTMTERTERSLVTRRSSMALSLAFSAVALLLSAVGLYGVLAYLVTQRTKEIGIRLALGSSAGAVFQLVLREGLLLLAAGLAIGVAGAVAISRILEGQLFGVHATDPLVAGLAIVTLGLVALGACTLPARRATRINPVIALAE
jgi:predicted permease